MHPVNEPVAGPERAVGILGVRSLEQLGTLHQPVAAPLDDGRVGAHDRRHHRGRELLARDARSLQDAPVVVAHLLDLLLDHLAQAIRRGRLDVLGRRARAPPVRTPDERALHHPLLRDLDDEERVPVRPPMDGMDERRRQRRAGEADREKIRHRVLAEERERNLVEESACAELDHRAAERVAADDDVDGPVRRQDEEARRLGAAREERDQVDRGAVAPLQVLEDEHQGAFGAERRDGFRHLAQHALGSRAEELATQRPAVVVRRRPRQLGEPERCALPEPADHPVALVAAEPTQGLQHGLVGLAGTVVLDALSDPDEGRAVAGELRREGARNGGLADARLAGDEDDLSRPAAGFFELCLEPPQHGLAFHEPDRDRRWRRTFCTGAVGGARRSDVTGATNQYPRR